MTSLSAHDRQNGSVALCRDRPVAGVVLLVVAAQANPLSVGVRRERDELGRGVSARRRLCETGSSELSVCNSGR